MTAPTPPPDNRPPGGPDLDAIAAAAGAVADAAGAVLMASFRDPALVVEEKADGSLVSRVDREAEDAARAALAASPFADFDVLGEEGGARETGTRYRWILDPLDGTISYTKGLPLFGTLVALEDREAGEVLVGLTAMPALGRRWSARKGGGCEGPGGACRVRAEADPAKAILVMGDPGYFARAGCRDQWIEMAGEFALVRGYTDCFGHGMLLDGAVGLLFDTCYKPWDLGPLRAQVPEAGGRLLTRPSGDPGSLDILAGSPALVARYAGRLGFEDPVGRA